MALDVAFVLNQWEAVGIFDLVLPFLLIFAVTFGILTATGILGGNKGIHVLISAVIGLMALRAGVVQKFFTSIFSGLGVGLAVIAALAILTGLFIEDEYKRYWAWGFTVIGFIIWLLIISDTFGGAGWYAGANIEDYAGLIIGAVLVVGLIIAVAAAKGSDKPSKPATFPAWGRQQ